MHFKVGRQKASIYICFHKISIKKERPMSTSSSLFKTSIAKKYWMALSGFFLMFFLLQHLLINMLSVFSADAFNEASEFMGTNPLVQYALQPVLFFGIIYHLVNGMILDVQNKKARSVKYAYNNAAANSSWVSRNMIVTGVMVLLFICLHMVDFFFPTIKAHYITHEHLDSFQMLANKFSNPIYVGIYVAAFVFLALHLLHGFQSAFQSVGARSSKYTPILQKIGTGYAIIIPVLYGVVAIFHFIQSL